MSHCAAVSAKAERSSGRVTVLPLAQTQSAPQAESLRCRERKRRALLRPSHCAAVSANTSAPQAESLRCRERKHRALLRPSHCAASTPEAESLRCRERKHERSSGRVTALPLPIILLLSRPTQQDNRTLREDGFLDKPHAAGHRRVLASGFSQANPHLWTAGLVKLGAGWGVSCLSITLPRFLYNNMRRPAGERLDSELQRCRTVPVPVAPEPRRNEKNPKYSAVHNYSDGWLRTGSLNEDTPSELTCRRGALGAAGRVWVHDRYHVVVQGASLESLPQTDARTQNKRKFSAHPIPPAVIWVTATESN
ncbi:hypothetical protein JZ751_015016, partial [Albula glossodonta]